MSDEQRPTNMDTVERMIDALDEITQTHRVRRSTPQFGSFNPKTWSWFTQLMTAILLVSTLVGILGRAFFVQRGEYTESERASSVTHESIRQTLDRVDRTLAAQTQAMAEISRAVQTQAVELAALKRK